MSGDRPDRAEAEQAVATLLRWIGEDPGREGLRRTPERVVEAWLEHGRGYDTTPEQALGQMFDEIEAVDEIVLLRDIRFESHCEHHLAPFVGRAHVAYLPDKRVAGLGRLARLVDCFAKRLQVQERLTDEIATSIQHILRPKGVAVMIEATHHCMTTRGAHKPGSTMVTSRLLGAFRTDRELRRDFYAMIGQPGVEAIARRD
jgi:GTP cyclohydrolase I